MCIWTIFWFNITEIIVIRILYSCNVKKYMCCLLIYHMFTNKSIHSLQLISICIYLRSAHACWISSCTSFLSCLYIFFLSLFFFPSSSDIVVHYRMSCTRETARMYDLNPTKISTRVGAWRGDCRTVIVVFERTLIARTKRY